VNPGSFRTFQNPDGERLALAAETEKNLYNCQIPNEKPPKKKLAKSAKIFILAYCHIKAARQEIFAIIYDVRAVGAHSGGWSRTPRAGASYG
jgi:hypothetical protein